MFVRPLDRHEGVLALDLFEHQVHGFAKAASQFLGERLEVAPVDGRGVVSDHDLPELVLDEEPVLLPLFDHAVQHGFVRTSLEVFVDDRHAVVLCAPLEADELGLHPLDASQRFLTQAVDLQRARQRLLLGLVLVPQGRLEMLLEFVGRPLPLGATEFGDQAGGLVTPILAGAGLGGGRGQGQRTQAQGPKGRMAHENPRENVPGRP